MKQILSAITAVSLVVLVALGNMGGCGGGDDDASLGVGIGPGSSPTPEPVAQGCASPPLNTNFSNQLITFFDTLNLVTMGLTSTGTIADIFLADLGQPAMLDVGGAVVSATECNVFAAIADLNSNGSFLDDPILPASGTCDLLNDNTTLEVDNLVVNGVALGVQLEGDCQQVITVTGLEGMTETQREEALTDILREKHWEYMEKFGGGE